MRNYYAAASLIGCTALLILYIRMHELESPTNYKIRFKKLLMYSIILCIADINFGLYFQGFYGSHPVIFYLIDYTYFTFTILVNKAWVEYAAIRIKDRKIGDLYTAFAWISFIIQMVLLLSNIVTKNAFYLKADMSYITGPTRSIIFGLQAVNALLLSVPTILPKLPRPVYDKEDRGHNLSICIMVIFTVFLAWSSGDSPMYSLGFMVINLSIYVFDITQQLIIKNRKLMTQHKDILKEQDAFHDVYMQAQKANEMKRAFLAAISHDMRTPMNAIMGMTKIAKANLNNPEKVTDCLDTVLYSSKQLLTMIDQLLDMNKIESGNLSMHTEFISLSEQMSTVIDLVSSQMMQKHITFETNILKFAHDDVYGDAKRIQQCCVILLSNAVQYTPEGGKVLFSVREIPSETNLQGCYEITVRDTGIGISPSEISRIFDPFYRTSDPRVQIYDGSGMGLAIVKNIVSVLNGSISVQSEPEKGTTFTMTIQLTLADEHEMPNPKKLHGHTALIIDENPVSCESMAYAISNVGLVCEQVTSVDTALDKLRQTKENSEKYSVIILDWRQNSNGLKNALAVRDIIGDTIPLVISSAYDWADLEDDSASCKANGFISKPLDKNRLESTLTTVILGSKTAKQRVNDIRERKLKLNELKVLLVEDNDLTRDIAIELLQMHEMQVDYAINGLEAIKKIEHCQDNAYDFILMDIQMPLMNGYEATKTIRSMNREYARKVPIIAMTANAFHEDKIAAQSAGMNDHMAKPLDIQKLIELLKKYL